MTYRRLFLTVLAVIAGAFVLASCGDDGGESQATSNATTDGPSDEDGETHDEESAEDWAFGAQADAAEADRTVDIVMNDDFTFTPDAIEITDGETVTFSIVNEGAIEHDFTIGDEATQDEHDAEMAEMAGMDDEGHGSDRNAVTVPAGETHELTWTFTDPGETVLFGCHVPGHYTAGMVGEFAFA